MIIQVNEEQVKWTWISVAFYLTRFGQASNVVLEFLEVIYGVFEEVKEYDWAYHLANIVRTNCKDCDAGALGMHLNKRLSNVMDWSHVEAEEEFSTSS